MLTGSRSLHPENFFRAQRKDVAALAKDGKQSVAGFQLAVSPSI
jgi:hypothetical protein